MDMFTAAPLVPARWLGGEGERLTVSSFERGIHSNLASALSDIVMTDEHEHLSQELIGCRTDSVVIFLHYGLYKGNVEVRKK